MDGTLLVIIIVAVIVFLLWSCRRKSSKNDSIKEEMKYMAVSLDRLADDQFDPKMKELADKIQQVAHSLEDSKASIEMKSIAERLRSASNSLKEEDSKGVKMIADLIDEMAGDLSTKEGFEPYYRGYYQPYWRYWKYYYPYRFYRPYYWYAGYW